MSVLLSARTSWRGAQQAAPPDRRSWRRSQPATMRRRTRFARTTYLRPTVVMAPDRTGIGGARPLYNPEGGHVSEANKEVVRRHYEDGVNNGDIAVATSSLRPGVRQPRPGPSGARARHPGLGGVLPGAEGRLPRHDHHPRAPPGRRRPGSRAPHLARHPRGRLRGNRAHRKAGHLHRSRHLPHRRRQDRRGVVGVRRAGDPAPARGRRRRTGGRRGPARTPLDEPTGCGSGLR
jgi:hypothetical protein